MSESTVAHSAPSPDDFPAWPRPDVPACELVDEFLEAAWSQEPDDLDRHLQDAEADLWETEPGPTETPDGRLVWPLGTLGARALRAAFDHYAEHLHERYGTTGDIRGWTYWAVRDMRDLLNGVLERHSHWRQVALDVEAGEPAEEEAE